ncbi:MAG: LysM peptidoglycan-binding domain-containing protein [Acidobacteria bacterium]|nr:LysM peptidoglycan-binding domain-containing protein [Acidobacteriota bacterium]MCI0625064.1 LysM peptidoglycan-binding domain-containing protein [Acidobacteriota bacterium]MCI0718463.1 LysM peptidoglycan-binding domain-containing protein [Acidobacteriota bacterium]
MGRLRRRIRRLATILPLVSFVFVSCKTTQPNRTPIAKLPTAEIPKTPAQNPLPVLPETPAKPVLPMIQQPLVDPIESLIASSQASFLRGEKSLKAGYLEKAKKDFDESLEILLRSGAVISQHERLERHYEALLDRIHNYELAALKEGDGFNEEKVEKAPLDEIASGEVPLTFDPKSKQLAEQTVQETPHDLPLPINDLVLRYLDYFQRRGRKTLETGMQRAGRYRAMISKILAEEGLPQDLIYLCQAESAFKPLAYSRAKCKGLWQFGAGTGALYGLRQNWWVDERSDPEKSTRAAARHLKDLYRQFGDWLLVMAAYNWGAGGVERAVAYTGYADYWELFKRNNLPAETKNYIPIILAMTIISKDPARYGFDVVPDPAASMEKVKLTSALDLRLVAESLDLTLAEVQELNPHVKRLTTPNNDPDFNLYVPQGMAEKFLQEIAAIPEGMRVNWRKHRVEEGETLSQIAQRYRTTTSAIAQANSLSEDAGLQFGNKLIIPVTPGQGGRGPVGSSGSRIRYTVQRGDTLASIARDFDVTTAQIRKWNRLSTRTKLRPGRVVSILSDLPASSVAAAQPPKRSRSTSAEVVSTPKPVRVVHRVKKGDTLYTIATNYNTSINSIRDWNKLSQNDNLRVGERLTIYVSR